MFENRELRKLFRPKRDKVTGGWKSLNNEALHDLYASQTFLRVIKSRKIRWALHVEGMGKGEVHRIFDGKT